MTTILGDKITLAHAYGGCSLNDPALTDWPGAIRMGVDNLDGWRTTADLNVVRTQRGVGDGDYIATRFASKSRMLIVEGYIHSPDRSTLDTLFDLLVVNAFPKDTDITLTRFEPVPKYVKARLAGTVHDTQYMPDGMRWSATLLCADPFKYDAVNTLSGSAGVSGVSTGGMTLPLTLPLVFNITANGLGNQVTLFNAGTGIAYPVITVTGPLPTGWRIENSTTGDTQSFSTDLLSTDTLVIDNYNKTAMLNGSPINGLVNGAWWSLRPGNNIIRLYGNYDPAAGFSISAKSSWR